jgi:hypothetical protein
MVGNRFTLVFLLLLRSVNMMLILQQIGWLKKTLDLNYLMTRLNPHLDFKAYP